MIDTIVQPKFTEEDEEEQQSEPEENEQESEDLPEAEPDHEPENPTSRPRKPIGDRIVRPYFGNYDKKLWDNKGMLGRIMAPIEDLYFEFIPDDEFVDFLQQHRPENHKIIS